MKRFKAEICATDSTTDPNDMGYKHCWCDAAVRAFYALGVDVPQYCANIFAVAGKRKKAGVK